MKFVEDKNKDDKDRSDDAALLIERLMVSLDVVPSVVVEPVPDLVSTKAELVSAAGGNIFTNTDGSLLEDAAILGQASLQPGKYSLAEPEILEREIAWA